MSKDYEIIQQELDKVCEDPAVEFKLISKRYSEQWKDELIVNGLAKVINRIRSFEIIYTGESNEDST